MPKKVSAQYRIKITKFKCDRCGLVVDGFRGDGFAAGIYDMASWEEYRRGNERYVCAPCMFADPNYLERYGSSF